MESIAISSCFWCETAPEQEDLMRISVLYSDTEDCGLNIASCSLVNTMLPWMPAQPHSGGVFSRHLSELHSLGDTGHPYSEVLRGLCFELGLMGALPGYRDGRKRAVSTNREQIPFIPFHRFPLSCPVPHEIGASFIRATAQVLHFLRPEVFIWSKLQLDCIGREQAACGPQGQSASDASKTDISKASASQTSRKMQLHHVKSL